MVCAIDYGWPLKYRDSRLISSLLIFSNKMNLTELQDKIAEYENRLAKIFADNGYALMINHSILENATGTIACGGICTIMDKKDIAYASVIQTTHTRLAFIDKIGPTPETP